MSTPGALLAGGAAGLAGGPSGLAGAVASAALAGVSSWVDAGATWMLTQLSSVVASSTRPALTSGWFGAHYAAMAALGAAATVPLLLAAAIEGVVRQDSGMLVRSALLELPAAALLSAAAVVLTQLGLGVVDRWSAELLGGVPLAHALAPAGAFGSGAPAFVGFVTALVVAVAALVLWIELAVRSAAVYVAVLFLPLALAGLVWPATARWARRLAETLAALVLAKLVIVGVLALATGALDTAGQGGLARAVAAVSLLLLATMAPFALLRLMPFVEAGAVAHLEGLRQRAVAAVGARGGGFGFGPRGPAGPGAEGPLGLPMAPPDEPPPHLVALLGKPGPSGPGGAWPAGPEEGEPGGGPIGKAAPEGRSGGGVGRSEPAVAADAPVPRGFAGPPVIPALLGLAPVGETGAAARDG